MFSYRGIEPLSNLATIAKRRATLHATDFLSESDKSIGSDTEVSLARKIDIYLNKLVICIVRKFNRAVKPTAKSRIAVDEPLHLLGIASDNDHKFSTLLLDLGEECFYYFVAEPISFLGETVGLINEQNSTKGTITDCSSSNRRLADVSGYQVGACNDLDLRSHHNAKSVINLCNVRSNSGFTGARISDEN